MNENKLNLIDKYVNLSNTKLTDPFTVRSNSGEIYPVTTKAAISSLNSGLGLRSRTFSNQLYKSDPDIWDMLKDKLSVSEDIQEFIESSKLVIVDKSVVGVVESSKDFDDLINTVESYQDDYTENEYKIYTNSSSVQIDIISPQGHGVSINYLLDHNWVTIYSVDFNRSTKYVSSYKQVDKRVMNDIEHLMDYEVIMTTSKLVIDESDNFLSVADQKKMSVNELIEQLKYDLQIRLTTEKVTSSDLSIEIDLTDKSTEVLDEILESLYSTSSKFINSPYLRRSVEFTDISYFKYYTMLALSPDSIELESLHRLATLVMKGSTNKDILE